jgi:hypothetical protein
MYDRDSKGLTANLLELIDGSYASVLFLSERLSPENNVAFDSFSYTKAGFPLPVLQKTNPLFGFRITGIPVIVCHSTPMTSLQWLWCHSFWFLI